MYDTDREQHAPPAHLMYMVHQAPHTCIHIYTCVPAAPSAAGLHAGGPDTNGPIAGPGGEVGAAGVEGQALHLLVGALGD